MKSRLLIAALACFALFSCSKDNEAVTPAITVASDAEFSADYTAEIVLTLSEKVNEDITVFFSNAELESGYKAFPNGTIKIDNSNNISSVIIPANSTSRIVVIEVDASELSDGKYQLAMQASSQKADVVEDKSIARINLTIGSEYEGDEGGEGGGDDTTPELTLQNSWTGSVVSVGKDEYGDYIQLSISASGSTYLGVSVLSDTDVKYYGGLESIVEAFQKSVTNNLSEGLTIDQVLWTEKEDIYVDYYESGKLHLYMIDFDANGKATGKYGLVDVDVPVLEGAGGGDDGGDSEGAVTGDVALQSSWKAELTGKPTSETYDGETYTSMDLNVSASGATYLWFEHYTEAEMSSEYEGKVENLLLDYSANAKSTMNEGYAMSQIYFAPDEEMYIYLWSSGETDIYIMDFDAEGNATGKYGKTHVTIPDFTSTSKLGSSLWDAGNRRCVRLNVNILNPGSRLGKVKVPAL